MKNNLGQIMPSNIIFAYITCTKLKLADIDLQKTQRETRCP